MEDVDENEVECWRRERIETDLQKVIVVWSDTEAGQETVDHQINVLTDAVLTTGEWLLSIKEQTLQQTQPHPSLRLNSRTTHQL